MVIAVIIVGVVQTSIYQIVVVIAVWNEWMSASIMSALTCNGGADIGVIGADRNHMLIIVPLVRVVQMSVMQIIHALTEINFGLRSRRVEGMTPNVAPTR